MRRQALRIALALVTFAVLAGCGGGGGGGGTSGSGVTVSVVPNTKTLQVGDTFTFAANVTGAANQAVTWSVQEANGGAITQAGAYTAPTTPGTYHVVATSQADSTSTGTATVTVTAPPTISVTVTPANPTVMVGAKQAFTASLTNTTDQSVTWSVRSGGAGGTIDQNGTYTAPATLGTTTTDTVVATSVADPTRSGTTTVTVTTAQVVSIAITPESVNLAPGGTRVFAATVSGDPTNAGVTWSIPTGSAGTVDASGLYIAPTAGGTYHVRATSKADTTKYAEATIVVGVGSGTVTVQ